MKQLQTKEAKLLAKFIIIMLLSLIGIFGLMILYEINKHYAEA